MGKSKKINTRSTPSTYVVSAKLMPIDGQYAKTKLTGMEFMDRIKELLDNDIEVEFFIGHENTLQFLSEQLGIDDEVIQKKGRKVRLRSGDTMFVITLNKHHESKDDPIEKYDYSVITFTAPKNK